VTKAELSEMAKAMAGIDIAILSTHTEYGEIANRPMSNMGDVAYNGTSHYFNYEQAERCRISRKMPRLPWAFRQRPDFFRKKSTSPWKVQLSSFATVRPSRRTGRVTSIINSTKAWTLSALS
jgi:hypothetical protein